LSVKSVGSVNEHVGSPLLGRQDTDGRGGGEISIISSIFFSYADRKETVVPNRFIFPHERTEIKPKPIQFHEHKM